MFPAANGTAAANGVTQPKVRVRAKGAVKTTASVAAAAKCATCAEYVSVRGRLLRDQVHCDKRLLEKISLDGLSSELNHLLSSLIISQAIGWVRGCCVAIIWLEFIAGDLMSLFCSS